MQNYNNDLKTLFYAFEDLLHCMQQQKPGIIKRYCTEEDYLKTPEYENALETHAFYIKKLNLTR